MLHVATMLWECNANSQPFSRCYDESWVEKLYRGFQRNLTQPFRFVVFTDKDREFSKGIEQERLKASEIGYGCCIEPFRLDEPSIIVGLDTIVVGNIDHMADYCRGAHRLALPRDPYQPARSINGVALVPRGYARIYDQWRGENDMEWLRTFECAFIDDIFPGEVLSLKFHDVRRKGLQGARIVYMHGRPKQDELGDFDWVRDNWK